MRSFHFIGLAAAILLIVSCFMPWVVVELQNIVVTGVSSEGTSFGKPGYVNLLMTLFYIVFMLVPRVWAKRANLLVISINIAWAIRNFFLISACAGGECPVKKTGLYLFVLATLLMFVSGLFPYTSKRER